MTLFCALFSAAACQTAPKLSDACDVLVPINPAPATNTYLIRNDRPTAEQIAKHRGRFKTYRCGA